jgi:glycosyltransferase involved in cell wall biosynthesis
VESCLDCVPRYGHESPAELTEGIRLHFEQYQSELARARAVVVGSPRTAELICTSTGFPAGRFTVLPMAYGRRFPGGTPPRTPLPAADEPFRFGYWGNLTRRKGAQVLLQAVDILCGRGPARPVEVHLFGAIDTDELRRELHQLARERPVVFHGHYADFEPITAARLHMAVFPIICFETFGFVLDEAVELGLPAIVTDIGAMPDRAGNAALAVPPGDPEALTQALEKVLDRPQLRDELAAHLPGLPPTVADHTEEILRIYERACTSPPIAEIRAVDPLRRAAFHLEQRESAQRKLHSDRAPR